MHTRDATPLGTISVPIGAAYVYPSSGAARVDSIASTYTARVQIGATTAIGRFVITR